MQTAPLAAAYRLTKERRDRGGAETVASIPSASTKSATSHAYHSRTGKENDWFLYFFLYLWFLLSIRRAGFSDGFEYSQYHVT
jgi:hypothetical protein